MLPASGAISLNQMHVEAGGASGTTCSINDSDIRLIADRQPSGDNLSFSEWRGKGYNEVEIGWAKSLSGYSDTFGYVTTGAFAFFSNSYNTVDLGGVSSTTWKGHTIRQITVASGFSASFQIQVTGDARGKLNRIIFKDGTTFSASGDYYNESYSNGNTTFSWSLVTYLAPNAMANPPLEDSIWREYEWDFGQDDFGASNQFAQIDNPPVVGYVALIG